MSNKKGAPDAITTAVAAVLREAVKDQHRKFPRLKDFKDALRARTGLADDTAERILNGKTSIRVDYFFHIAGLLEIDASVLMAEAERRYAADETRSAHSETAPLPEPSKAPRHEGEDAVRLGGMVESLGGTIQAKRRVKTTAPAPTEEGDDAPPTPGRPHAI